MPSRRAVLSSIGGVVAGSLAGCQGYQQQQGGIGGGNVSSGGVGSGFAYEQPAVTQDQAHASVTTADQLIEAVQQGTPENPVVLWIPGDAAIDMTGRDTILLENVVLASSRHTGHVGGLIYSNSMGQDSAQYPSGGLFRMGQNSRITGLRIRGPTSAVWDHPMFPGYIPFGSGSSSARAQYRNERMARGITIEHGAVQIDNCEIFGWATQGILSDCPRSWGSEYPNQDQSYPRIQNCSIHDNALSGLGYGLEVDHGHPLVEQTFFNGCRHMVAGEGWPDSGYTLSECFFGPAGSLFPIDQHYLGENISGSSSPDSYDYRYHSGELMRILNCTIAFSHVIDIAATSSISQGGNPFAGNQTPAISIGSLPTEGVVINGNRFVHGSLSSAVSQGRLPNHAETDGNGYARMEIGENQLGLQTNFSVGQP